MGGRIFINYRRGDDPGFTQALFARLEAAFEPDELFLDIDSIEPGLDFVRVLEEQIDQCDIFLAVIGPGWLGATDEHGCRRLENENDFVRVELESGLKLGKRIIPVLVNNAEMPRAEHLPDSLKPLARRHAIRLTHERFKADAEGLVRQLKKAIQAAEASKQAKSSEAAEQMRKQPESEEAGQVSQGVESLPVRQARSGVLPAVPAQRRSPTVKNASRSSYAVIAFVALMAVIVVAGYFFDRANREAKSKPGPATQGSNQGVSNQGYVVKVGDWKSQTEALGAFADLQQKYPSLLQDYRPSVQKLDRVVEGAVYRLFLGPMDGKTEAYELCRELKSQGWPECWVIRY